MEKLDASGKPRKGIEVRHNGSFLAVYGLDCQILATAELKNPSEWSKTILALMRAGF